MPRSCARHGRARPRPHHGCAPRAAAGAGYLYDATLGRVSAHAGSWGSYYAIAIVIPGARRAVAVMCNCYGTEAVQQLDTLARRLALGVRP